MNAVDIRMFAHSWLADWNHGNAHFLRGWARALVRRGHSVKLYEALPGPWGDWSLAQLVREEPLAAMAAIAEFRATYQELEVEFYPLGPVGEVWLETAMRGADVVIAHEWNRPELFHSLASLRRRHGFLLLLHDTHHRGQTQPDGLAALPLGELDGVLTFGESLRRLYERRWGVRAFTLHEAADVEVFSPGSPTDERGGVLWIGNWGDEERTGALREYLLQPAQRLPEIRFAVHGVRYPPAGLAELRARSIAFHGYLPNLRAAAAYRACAVALHIPRMPYMEALPGIPTIRVFEAMACGAALITAPWNDEEALFQLGTDYWQAKNGAECTAMIAELHRDAATARRLGRHARSRIVQHHTCGHRARELEAIVTEITGAKGDGIAHGAMADGAAREEVER